MTPEEWVEYIGTKTMYEFTRGAHDDAVPTHRRVLVAALRDAIAEEREACAKLAADQGCTKVACGENGHGYHACPQSIAAAIRARQ